ncbi:MAG: aldose epimerase, partial [Pseudoxanthomonas sp.]
SEDRAELSLRLPRDERWPFGGTARQTLQVEPRRLRLTLRLEADETAMPGVIGWHPWFRKPDRIEFAPSRMYPRDSQGIATLPLVEPKPGPWDDCFINRSEVVIHRAGQRLHLASDCTHWVVFDERAHATCIEPQSGPPDAFNLSAAGLPPEHAMESSFELEWK